MTGSEQVRLQREGWTRRTLIALAVLVVIAAMSATLTYSYPQTLGVLHAPMLLIHDLSGDAAVLASGLYLWLHLSRTWRMKKLTSSRYSGLFGVFLWFLAAVTGVYGQVAPFERGDPLYTLHIITSLGSVVLACGHGAWAFRPKRPVRPKEG